MQAASQPPLYPYMCPNEDPALRTARAWRSLLCMQVLPQPTSQRAARPLPAVLALLPLPQGKHTMWPASLQAWIPVEAAMSRIASSTLHHGLLPPVPAPCASQLLRTTAC